MSLEIVNLLNNIFQR